MATYASLVERDLVEAIRADLASWSDGQILPAGDDRIVEIMVGKHGYGAVEFVEGAERRELLEANEPAAGVRVHVEFRPMGQPGLKEFLELQASHHRAEPPLELRGNRASFVVRPMSSAEEVRRSLDAIRANVAMRNRDIAQGEAKLRTHAQNLVAARRREAEAAQAEAARAVAELDELGIPDFEAPPNPLPRGAEVGRLSAPADTREEGAGDEPETAPALPAAAAAPRAGATSIVGQLNPHLDRIRDLVERILERGPDEFTALICEEILGEVGFLGQFATDTAGGPAGPAVVELPRRLVTARDAFNWIGGAMTGKGIDLLDDLGTELLDAGALIGQLFELAMNPPI